MITINESRGLIDLQRELENNGYKFEEGIRGQYRKNYYVGKSWKNFNSMNGMVLESILISHVVRFEGDFIEWDIYFRGVNKYGGVLRAGVIPDRLLEQFNKSIKVLYNEVKKSKVFISRESSSLPRNSLSFGIYSKELAINGGEDVKKLLKVLPSIAKRIDSILVRKQRGRM